MVPWSPRIEKRDFLKDRPIFPNRISEWKMCVPFYGWFLLVPGHWPWIAFDGPIFRKWRGNGAHPRGNFQFWIWRVPFTATVNQPVSLVAKKNKHATNVVPISRFAPVVGCFPLCQTERSVGIGEEKWHHIFWSHRAMRELNESYFFCFFTQPPI